MKVFIDGYGVVLEHILSKLINIHKIKKDCIFIKSYEDILNSNTKIYCQKNEIMFHCENYKNKTLLNKIHKFKPDVILSLYGRELIPLEILKHAGNMTMNVHPSLLPNYKGCFATSWVIINGEEKTGLTFHNMNENFDEGNILCQWDININIRETAYTLHHKMISKIIENFDDFFINWVNNNIVSKKMDLKGNYYQRKLPYNGIIDDNWDLKRIDNFIRSMHFPPLTGALATINGEQIEVNSIERYKLLKGLK